MSRKYFNLLLIIACSCRILYSQEIIDFKKSESGLINQPNGNFSVYLFNESALGNFIGIIYSEKMKKPVDGNWKIDDRFWQSSEWSNDVVSFYWLNNKKEALVSTSGIYGTGKLFKLDLLNRSFDELYEAKRLDLNDSFFAPSVIINKIDELKMEVELVIFYDESIINEMVVVSFK
jgi:hypothetical protein